MFRLSGYPDSCVKRSVTCVDAFADRDSPGDRFLRLWVQSARQVRAYALGEPWCTRSGDVLGQLVGRRWRVLLGVRRTGERLEDALTAMCEQRAEELVRGCDP